MKSKETLRLSLKKALLIKKCVGIFVFKTPQGLEQLWFIDSIHNENNKKGLEYRA